MSAFDNVKIFEGLGFRQEGIQPGDFMLRRDAVDAEPYVFWTSNKPCPRPDLVRLPVEVPKTQEYLAQKQADKISVENNIKEADDMIKAAEVVAEAIAQVDRITALASRLIYEAEAERDKAIERAEIAEKALRELTKASNLDTNLDVAAENPERK